MQRPPPGWRSKPSASGRSPPTAVVLAHATETACSTDGPTLIETINTIKDLEVTTGTVTYDGTAGVPEKDVSILTVTDEKPTLETTLRPAFIPAD